MGVNLTPIVVKKVVALENLRGRSFAVDGFVVLHQFLALIRARDGQSLMDAKGRTTSHLVGLAFRTTRLVADYGMKLYSDGEAGKVRLRITAEALKD